MAAIGDKFSIPMPMHPSLRIGFLLRSLPQQYAAYLFVKLRFSREDYETPSGAAPRTASLDGF